MKVVYHGIDLRQFSPEVRDRLRVPARQTLGLSDGAFTLLLIGNDWKKKGFASLLEALERLQDVPLHLLVVGRDDPTPFRTVLTRAGLDGRVAFLPPRRDVEFYYAAADCYVAPSLEDAFALPVAEAMACGLPVIVSRSAGASEIVTDGVDGLILEDPRDSVTLATLIRRLYEDPDLRSRLAAHAAQTAGAYTWEKAAGAMHDVFQEIIWSHKSRRRLPKAG
ncbi:MAG: glycosyltransferase family 4 protein [Acidobacteria bacterium]|nr:glycosyltransferase family 4 protein [Acidobacteriota bacterium]MDW7984647.1 glycosyltransferase family 4 protein [Acidobacteriota bacterium]